MLESLCERPLTEGQTEPPAELLALCRKAATVLLQDSHGKLDREADSIADTDRVTAALAEILCRDNAGARHIIEVAAARSAAVRLDIQSALAFVDAVEQSPQSAPAHLLNEVLTADHTGSTRPTAPFASVRTTRIWSHIAGSFWSVRRWRIAVACAVLFVAGVASWSVWQRPDPAAEGSMALPAAKTTNEPPAVAVSPAPPTPKLAAPQPCKPLDTTNEASKASPSPPTEVSKAEPSTEIDCTSPPGHQFADRPTEEIEAIAARARLEAARQAAAERAAEAAGKIGAAQAGGERGPIAADRISPLNGMPGRDVPAAASSAPSAPPSYGIAPPAAAPAARPNPVGR